VLEMAQPYAQNTIDAFNQIGATPAPAITPVGASRGKRVPTTTTTTTIPADVYANTQPEPWNPFPCTLGQSTQASPRTTTTTVRKK